MKGDSSGDWIKMDQSPPSKWPKRIKHITIMYHVPSTVWIQLLHDSRGFIPCNWDSKTQFLIVSTLFTVQSHTKDMHGNTSEFQTVERHSKVSSLQGHQITIICVPTVRCLVTFVFSEKSRDTCTFLQDHPMPYPGITCSFYPPAIKHGNGQKIHHVLRKKHDTY